MNLQWNSNLSNLQVFKTLDNSYQNLFPFLSQALHFTLDFIELLDFSSQCLPPPEAQKIGIPQALYDFEGYWGIWEQEIWNDWTHRHTTLNHAPWLSLHLWEVSTYGMWIVSNPKSLAWLCRCRIHYFIPRLSDYLGVSWIQKESPSLLYRWLILAKMENLMHFCSFYSNLVVGRSRSWCKIGSLLDFNFFRLASLRIISCRSKEHLSVTGN